MANFTGLQYTPTQADTGMMSYGGDISGYLGRNFSYGDLTGLNNQMKTPAGSQSTFQQNGNIYQIGDAGNNQFNLKQVGTVAGRQNDANQQNFGNLVNASNSAITDFLSGYKADTASAITNANNQFNIPNQTNMVNALNSRINDLSTNFSNSGAGGFANANQVDAAINSRYLPQLQTATTNLNTSTGEAQQQEQIALQPDQAYAGLLATNITTAMQGLTSTEQTVMNGILGQLSAGVSLTEAQWQMGNNIAQKLIDQATQTTVAQIGQQFQPVSAGSTLTNTKTGAITNPGILAASGAYTP